MGIDFDRLPGPAEEGPAGIGGRALSKTLPAVIAFNDPGSKVYVYHIGLSVIQPNKDIEHIPSLLGRDVLNQWTMRYSYPTRRLTASVVSANFIFPVTPQPN